ncbi:hypothetical protein BV25DRAFT_1531629 [Artomyces pyxidatus]|uniref:Uncharacterized protein n=1 Tax=Artomyces pyxidatus TaxID=48021 RepID=A0ACB8TDF2_9AGAM|nr:hypothetical protein BV25DRAFT_1531629 [Artomyces pyxidatus]
MPIIRLHITMSQAQGVRRAHQDHRYIRPSSTSRNPSCAHPSSFPSFPFSSRSGHLGCFPSIPPALDFPRSLILRRLFTPSIFVTPPNPLPIMRSSTVALTLALAISAAAAPTPTRRTIASTVEDGIKDIEPIAKKLEPLLPLAAAFFKREVEGLYTRSSAPPSSGNKAPPKPPSTPPAKPSSKPPSRREELLEGLYERSSAPPSSGNKAPPKPPSTPPAKPSSKPPSRRDESLYERSSAPPSSGNKAPPKPPSTPPAKPSSKPPSRYVCF